MDPVWLINVLAQALLAAVAFRLGRGPWFTAWLCAGVAQSVILLLAVGDVRKPGWSYIAFYTISEMLVLLGVAKAALEVFRQRAFAYRSVGKVGTWCWWAGMGAVTLVTLASAAFTDAKGWQSAPLILLTFRRSVIWILLGYLVAAVILFGHSTYSPARMRIRHLTLLAWLTIHGLSMVVSYWAGPASVHLTNRVSLIAMTTVYSAAAFAFWRSTVDDHQRRPDPAADYALMKADRLLEELTTWRPR